jgi:hypothetical protein
MFLTSPAVLADDENLTNNQSDTSITIVLSDTKEDDKEDSKNSQAELEETEKAPTSEPDEVSDKVTDEVVLEESKPIDETPTEDSTKLSPEPTLEQPETQDNTNLTESDKNLKESTVTSNDIEDNFLDTTANTPNILATNNEISTSNGQNPNSIDLDDGVTQQDIVDFLLGPGNALTNFNMFGNNAQIGLFYDMQNLTGIGNGVILSSGNVKDIIGTNDTSSNTTSFSNSQQDPDLSPVVNGSNVNDLAFIELSFIPTSNQIEFEFVFGSEEYLEYVGSSFNDVGAIFVNGVNCSLINGNPTSVNAINNNSNSADFIDNSTGTIQIEADGLTLAQTCNAALNPGIENTVKIAVADVGDTVLDSWFFVKGGGTVEQVNPSSIGDIVFIDANGNNVQDNNEAGLAGVIVELYEDNGNGIFDDGDILVNTTTTGNNGAYTFQNVNPDNYLVVINQNSLANNYQSQAEFLVEILLGQNYMDADFPLLFTGTSIVLPPQQPIPQTETQSQTTSSTSGQVSRKPQTPLIRTGGSDY